LNFHCDAIRSAAAVGLAATLLIAAAPADAAGSSPGEIVATPTVVRDFLVQDVCLDGHGAVLPGVSPVDGNPACLSQRDLRPGERLPYHKHDHPSPEQRAGAPLGYQRHDSFPVETAGFGPVVEHSFDFGIGEGRRFGVFDAGSDGGDITVVSTGRVSIAATEDGGLGFQLFVGECEGLVTAAALTHSWIVAEFAPDRAAPLQGNTIARLGDLTTGQQETCPARFGAAFTHWHVVPFHYRAARGQGSPLTLTTLISDHYGGARRDTADHVERFYFTRELGSTRWERWQNAAGNRRFSPAQIAELGKAITASGRCSVAEMPEGGAVMVMVDCREWTRVVPPVDPAGDRPGFFLEALRARPNLPAFFAAPGTGK
jgi:hypothetical protein